PLARSALTSTLFPYTTLFRSDGRDQEAVALFVANLATFTGSRADLDLPIARRLVLRPDFQDALRTLDATLADQRLRVLRMLCGRSEEHTSELQSRGHLVCRLL